MFKTVLFKERLNYKKNCEERLIFFQANYSAIDRHHKIVYQRPLQCAYVHILKFDCYVAFFDSKKYSLWPKLKKFSLFALTSYMAQNWKSILEIRLRIPLCTTLWKASWISWSGLFPVNEGDVSDGFAKGVVERFGTFLWVNVNARSSDRKPVGSRSKVTN